MNQQEATTTLWRSSDFRKQKVMGWDGGGQSEFIIKRPDGTVLPHRPKSAQRANELIRAERDRHNAEIRDRARQAMEGGA